ncbi:uncharacterized protein VICG_02145, partial [Vittaforma corneae ATCC 50505]
ILALGLAISNHSIFSFITPSRSSTNQSHYHPNSITSSICQTAHSSTTVNQGVDFRALDDYSRHQSQTSVGSLLKANPLFQDVVEPLMVKLLAKALDDINSITAVGSDLGVVIEKLSILTKLFDQINIRDHKYKNEMLTFLNSEYGLKDMKIEDLCEFYVFKITYGANSYILKQIGHSVVLDDNNTNLRDLLAEYVNSPNVIEILHVFERHVQLKAGEDEDKYTWYLTEYLDVGLDSDYVKLGGIDMIRKVSRDALNGLKAFHDKYITHGDIGMNHVRGIWETKEDGSRELIFKFFDFGIAKYHMTDESLYKGIADDFLDLGTMLRVLSLGIGIMDPNPKNPRGVGLFTSNGEGYIFTIPNAKFIDFIFICLQRCEKQPRSVEDLLNHPFLTGMELDLNNDQYGKRYYSAEKLLDK